MYRSVKVRTLRESAAEFRGLVGTAAELQVSTLSAMLLEQRADRIEAGAEDHSAVPLDTPEDVRAEPGADAATERDSAA